MFCLNTSYSFREGLIVFQNTICTPEIEKKKNHNEHIVTEQEKKLTRRTIITGV